MAISPLKAMNGERAVVFLFVFLVLYPPFPPSTRFLPLLSLRRDPRRRFHLPLQNRASASSGIMLGAVTLPTVMLSKLIQLSRALALQGIEIGELEHMTKQFWATSACCCSVLIFLFVDMWCAANDKNQHFTYSVWDAKFNLSCIILFSAVCCISLATISHTGFNTALKLLWLLCHGFAAVKLIQHLLNKFPCCASIGEAFLVTSGLALYFGDMLACTISKVRTALSLQIQAVMAKKSSRISILMLTTLFEQGVLLGLLIFSAVFNFFIRLWEYYWGADNNESRQSKEIRRSLIFFTFLGFIMIAVAPSWMMIALDFDVHPVLWIFQFVFSEPFKRPSLCIYWLGLIYAFVLRFYNISKNSKIERILLRKYLPSAGSFNVSARSYLPGKLVHQFMSDFTDHCDSDLLIVSHFSLLLGCALPIWMSSGFNDRPLTPPPAPPLVPYLQSINGRPQVWCPSVEQKRQENYRRHCSWYPLTIHIIDVLKFQFPQHWYPLIIAVTTSGLLEAYTTQLDNAFIPLVFCL
ncbi:hypothetical protein DITRI_Ditri05aG0013400 [Diplodiscus trichospermus]